MNPIRSPIENSTPQGQKFPATEKNSQIPKQTPENLSIRSDNRKPSNSKTRKHPSRKRRTLAHFFLCEFQRGI